MQGTNYFGTFLLTHLLLDKLKQTAQEKGHARYEKLLPAGQLVNLGWHVTASQKDFCTVYKERKAHVHVAGMYMCMVDAHSASRMQP